jgi:hypothetical protein
VSIDLSIESDAFRQIQTVESCTGKRDAAPQMKAISEALAIAAGYVFVHRMNKLVLIFVLFLEDCRQ